ncbi:MAG TPA: DUF4919 domain-containing protein [Gammaproteobacteria bacterium]
MRLYSIILGSALLAGCSGAVKKDASILNEHVEYGRQVALAKNFSKETDFTALRMAYTETGHYSPYAVKDIKPIIDAMQKEDFGRCRRLALRHLEREFVSLAANYAAMVCHKELGKEDISDRYRFILNGLIDSIFESGDGRSADTAFVTISGEELYSFIRLSGLAVESQSLVRKNGRVFDLMKVVDPETDEKVNLYFDVTLQTTKGLKFPEK